MASKVDELLIEEPGELEVQCGIMRYLAGQHDALAHRHVQMSCRTGDHGRLCKHAAPHQQNGLLYILSPDCPDCLLHVQ